MTLERFVRGAAAATTAVVCVSAALLGQATRPYSRVTDERLLRPEPRNWPMYRRTYDGWGYSPLARITRANVARLVPAWTFSTGVSDGHESPPIVNDGVMFVTTPRAQVLALNAATGDLLWRYVRPLPEELVQFHPTNRGVALYDDKVYVATVDGFLVCLKASDGTVVWERVVGDYKTGYYVTMAPLAARGKIMVGVSGGEFGIRGFVQAFDAASGEPAWKTYTIPGPGERGHDTWPGESWRTGGVPAWVTGTFDPELNLTYWGTGNPGPWIGEVRPGDNLYANSVIALDADTGRLRGYHQYHWNDSWDWDEVSAPILVDIPRGGRTVKGLVHAGRNGYLWILERTADRINFVDARPFVFQNVFSSVDPKSGRPTYNAERRPGPQRPATFCPAVSGGKNWPPAAYNPTTGFIYIPANENLCSTLQGVDVEYQPGRRFMGVSGSRMSIRDGADHIGELQAWDLATGRRVWMQPFQSQNWGPVLTTGGGLVFAGGTNDRYFRAFDARSGEVLWQQRTNSGVIGVPVTFEVDGVQYVAVQSGWGVDAQRVQAGLDIIRKTTTFVPQGGVVWVFRVQE